MRISKDDKSRGFHVIGSSYGDMASVTVRANDKDEAIVKAKQVLIETFGRPELINDMHWTVVTQAEWTASSSNHESWSPPRLFLDRGPSY